MEGYPVHTLYARVKLNVSKINNGMSMSLYQKSLLLALSALCFLSTTVHTQDNGAIETAIQLRDAGMASGLAWEIVEGLTTEVGPRLAGTEADHRAVEWAKRKLELLSFDKVWLERIEFPVWVRYHESARITAPFPQKLHITALGYSGSTDGEVTADVAGFTSLDALRDAPLEQVNGRIVFINYFTERTRTGEGYSNSVQVRYDAGELAKEKGAVAVLIRSIGTDSHRFPHTGVSTLSSDPLPAAALSAPDADQLARIMERGETVRISLFIRVAYREAGHSWNVIAQVNGRETPEKVVLIGAHLDSWDLGTGALDDGAGVAITAAAAHLIGELPRRPRSSIRLVLFGNEEAGLWGAKQYVAANAGILGDHLYASESDFGARAIWRFDTDNPVLMETAMPVLEALGIEKGEAATSGGPDIVPLQDKGVRIFRLLQDGTDYFDYHHTADDTLDKIDPELLKQNVAAWAAVSYLAAELKD